jgi:hypothetical protein
MNEKPQGVAYTRSSETRNTDAPYEKKFEGLIKAIAENKGGGMKFLIVSEPWVIGDTYDEIIESLARLAGTNFSLLIAQREVRLTNN